MNLLNCDLNHFAVKPTAASQIGLDTRHNCKSFTRDFIANYADSARARALFDSYFLQPKRFSDLYAKSGSSPRRYSIPCYASDSNLLVQGSQIHADHNISLFADNQVLLLAGQNTSESTSSSKSNSGSIGVSFGVSGDGGFNINVAGNTSLTGAVITSTQQAHEQGKNSFQTGGSLSITDIHNSASYTASASNFSAGLSVGKDAQTGQSKTTPSGSAGVGSASGSSSSVTASGITGIAGDATVVTGKDTTNALAPIFDADAVKKDVNAQVTITAQFGAQASEAWGKYANDRFLDSKASEEERACWSATGNCRASGHALIGALTGGASGAAGAAVSSFITPQIGAALLREGVDPAVVTALMQLGGTLAGAAVGGTSGAAAGLNEASNNAAALINLINLAAQRAAAQVQRLGAAGVKALSEAEVAMLRQCMSQSWCNGLIPASVIAAFVANNPPSGTSTTLPIAQPIPGTPGLVAPPPDGNNGTVLPSTTPVNAGSNNTGGDQITEPAPGGNVTTTPMGEPQGPNIMISDSRTPVPEVTTNPTNGLPYQSNDKHTPGAPSNFPNAGTEPRNSFDLFGSSVPYANPDSGKVTRYAVDQHGEVHRFFADNNGFWHWSGSTGDSKVPLSGARDVPIEIRRLPGVNRDIRTGRR